MITKLIAKPLWKRKINRRKEVLKQMPFPAVDKLVSLDDYLDAANTIALDYIANHLKYKLNYSVDCFTYAIYTYAAFLLLTDNGNQEFQKEVKLCGGLHSSKDGFGSHSYLQIKARDEWEPYETIPWNRNKNGTYSLWFQIQVIGDKIRLGERRDIPSYPYLLSYFFNN